VGHPSTGKENAALREEIDGLIAGGVYALVLVVLRTPELGSLLAVLRRRAPAEV